MGAIKKLCLLILSINLLGCLTGGQSAESPAALSTLPPLPTLTSPVTPSPPPTYAPGKVDVSLELVLTIGHGILTDVSISPDGDLIAVSTAVGVLLYEARSVEFITLLPTPHDRIWTLEWSPDGSHLAGGSMAGEIYLWDIQTHNKIFSIEAHPGELEERSVYKQKIMIRDLAWSHDGTVIASAGLDSYVRFWSSENGSLIDEITRGIHRDMMAGVEWIPESDSVILFLNPRDDINLGTSSVSPKGAIFVRDASREYLSRWDLEVMGITGAISPDGKWLAIGAAYNILQIYDVQKGKLDRDFSASQDGDVASIAWSPDGTKIAAVGYQHGVRILDALTGETISILRGHTADVFSVEWFPDGERLLTAAWDGTVRIWEAGRSITLPLPPSQTNGITSITWDSHSQRLASADWDGNLIVWDTSSGILLDRLHLDDLGEIDWSPIGDLIAIQNESALSLWDLETLPPIIEFEPGMQRLFTAQWSPDGRYLAWGGASVILWDQLTGDRRELWNSGNQTVHFLTWSPDGAHLAARIGNRIFLWDLAPGGLHHYVGYSYDFLYSLSWHPGGKLLAAAYGAVLGSPGAVRIWDVETGKIAAEITDLTNLRTISWSPDGRWLITAGKDGSIHIWDALTFELVHSTITNQAGIFTLAWSPDGATLATAGRDGILRFWKLVIDR